MKTIGDIKAELEALKTKVAEVNKPYDLIESELLNDLKANYERSFEQNKSIQASINAVLESNDLTSVENDEWLSKWASIQFDLPQDESELDALKEYLSENHGVYLDVKNEALTSSIGSAILIGEDGSVYDQDCHKFIINKNEYSTKEELCALIEAYMEKQGYFSSVVRIDRYNNAYYVNTKGGN